MFCRYCGAELEESATVCPSCGEAQPEAPKPKKKSWIPIAAVICCVALVVGLIAWFVQMNTFPGTQNEKVTLKACYTESDETVMAKHDTVVAKAGPYALTNGELQVLYWSMVYDFLDYYGSYASYYVDFTKPLSGQYCNEENGITWEHYFLDMALRTWYRYEVLADNAEKAGVKLDETLQNRLDNMYETMEKNLESAGFETVEDMVRHDFGKAATFEDYMAYMNIYYKGNNYYNYLYEQVELTEAQIEDYYTKNEADLVEAGYGKDAGDRISVRHILIEPENEDWEACEATARALMNQWVEGGADEESFAALAVEHSACSSAPQGGLLAGFVQGDMVEPFDNWCFEEAHAYGDYGLVKTEFGYHIIFFVEGAPLWRDAVTATLTNDVMYQTMEAMEAEQTLVVAYSRIVLADVSLG